MFMVSTGQQAASRGIIAATPRICKLRVATCSGPADAGQVSFATDGMPFQVQGARPEIRLEAQVTACPSGRTIDRG